MTEQEYINVTDLENTRSAKVALLDIEPGSSPVVDKREWKKIIQILSKWESDLGKVIQIKLV
jgi:hypothetical protein